MGGFSASSDLTLSSVRSRLESQQGLSFTEFTYQLLQAYDFFHLHKHHSCTVQVGGSDQWGNITAGLELIGRLNTEEDSNELLPAYGFTTPLLTTASGEKFGKSSGNAVWLDSTLTSVFDFYQVLFSSLLRGNDADFYAIVFPQSGRQRRRKILENIHTPTRGSDSGNHIRTLGECYFYTSTAYIHITLQEAPEKRVAQRVLAAEVTELVHSSKLSRNNCLT